MEIHFLRGTGFHSDQHILDVLHWFVSKNLTHTITLQFLLVILNKDNNISSPS